LTVALGRAGFDAPSGGSVIRAVSFLGAAARAVAAGAGTVADDGGGGTGLSGTVGLAGPSEGGLGGGVTPAGLRMPPGAGLKPEPRGLGGGGTKGRGAPAGGADGSDGAEGGLGKLGADGDDGTGAGGAEAAGGVGAGSVALLGSLVVSFFGVVPAGDAARPGRLMRTVSRFTACCSCFGGRVMRMVSALEASSDSDGAGGISSAITEG
jgi:hypothetical protein